MTAHSKIGASSAYRWMACPASVGLAKKLEGEGHDLSSSSSASEEGTLAHALLSSCLETGVDTWQLADIQGVTTEMLVHVQTSLDALRALPGERFIEQNVSLEHLYPGAFGTLDFAAMDSKNDLLSVVDFKYGRYRVDPKNNPQLRYYALGLAYPGITGSVRIGILQPKVQGSGIVWGETLTWAELESWGEDLKRAMELTEDPTAPMVPGDHCHFCPAKKFCPAQSEMISDTFSGTKSPHDMSNEELGARLAEAKHLRAYFDTLEAEAFSRLEQGKKVEGWKLSYTKPSRKWQEGAEQKLVAIFGEGAYKKSINTPAQIEKLPGGTAIAAELSFFPKGSPTIVPASNPSATSPRSAVVAFADYIGK